MENHVKRKANDVFSFIGGYVEVTNNILQVSGLHKAKSSRLNATGQDRKKIHSRNTGDVILKIITKCFKQVNKTS